MNGAGVGSRNEAPGVTGHHEGRASRSAAPKFTLVKRSREAGMRRLRQARLDLRTATEQSRALRRATIRERIDRECERLKQLHGILLDEARHVGKEPRGVRELAVRVAMFYQHVGTLERNIESFLTEFAGAALNSFRKQRSQHSFDNDFECAGYGDVLHGDVAVWTASELDAGAGVAHTQAID